jgi:transposase
MKKKYITKNAWNQILVFLKGCDGIYLGRKSELKKFIEGIYWMSRTGAQWRELPERYGKWNTVYHRFNEWTKKGIWNQFLSFCASDPDLEYQALDSTIVRAHACAAGYGDQEEQALGRSKGGFTSKIHAKVDALGNLLQISLTPGNRNDITQAPLLLNNIANSHILGDKGYSSYDIRDLIISLDGIPVIPPKSNLKEPWEYDENIYKERNVIECFFSKIKHFRRVFSRFDKSARNFAAFISFVGAIIWLR